MSDKLRRLIATVFGVAESAVDENSSPDTIEEWDSLRHLNLVLALEEAYGITFSEEEITELLNVKLIQVSLAEKGVTA